MKVGDVREGQFATWLEQKLREGSIKRGDFAEAVGVDSDTVRRWLKGEYTPQEYYWAKIAAALEGVKLGDVVTQIKGTVTPIRELPGNGMTEEQIRDAAIEDLVASIIAQAQELQRQLRDRRSGGQG